MFAEKIELNLVEDLNEIALVELNAADVEEVSGGIIPVVVVAAVFAAGVVTGYYAGSRR